MKQINVLQLEEVRTERIHPLHIFMDYCRVEGNGLFCLTAVGKVRMSRLQLK